MNEKEQLQRLVDVIQDGVGTEDGVELLREFNPLVTSSDSLPGQARSEKSVPSSIDISCCTTTLHVLGEVSLDSDTIRALFEEYVHH